MVAMGRPSLPLPPALLPLAHDGHDTTGPCGALPGPLGSGHGERPDPRLTPNLARPRAAGGICLSRLARRRTLFRARQPPVTSAKGAPVNRAILWLVMLAANVTAADVITLTSGG